MIFKRVQDGNPHIPTTTCPPYRATILPRQFRLDELSTTTTVLALDRLLSEDSTFYGDLFAYRREAAGRAVSRTACIAPCGRPCAAGNVIHANARPGRLRTRRTARSRNRCALPTPTGRPAAAFPAPRNSNHRPRAVATGAASDVAGRPQLAALLTAAGLVGRRRVSNRIQPRDTRAGSDGRTSISWW